jgi:hypothetical protein
MIRKLLRWHVLQKFMSHSLLIKNVWQARPSFMATCERRHFI